MRNIDLPIDAIARCAADPRFRAEMACFYEGVDAEIDARNPTCSNRGHCCQFVAFDHRLFVTSAELAYFVARTTRPTRDPDPAGPCLYQVDGLCTARHARPAGCRVFFCDPAAQHWQPATTETALKRLRAVHDRFALPYAYVEWLSALRCLNEAGSGVTWLTAGD